MKHKEFILKPMITVIKEAVQSTEVIDNSMTIFPLTEYIMKSLFLNLTGFQEQKIKCIAWEIAYNNYKFREEFKNKIKTWNEFSSYNTKNEIFKKCYEINKELKEENNISYNKEQMETIKLIDIKNELIECIKNSNLVKSSQRDFYEFCMLEKIKNINILEYKGNTNKVELLEIGLQEIYELVYQERNRLAHNTLSYQQRFPIWKKSFIKNRDLNNYFLYFLVLCYIDRIFIKLFEEFSQLLENNLYM